MVWFCGVKVAVAAEPGALAIALSAGGVPSPVLPFSSCMSAAAGSAMETSRDVLESFGERLLRRHPLANPEVVAFASALRRLDGSVPLFIGFVIEHGLGV